MHGIVHVTPRTAVANKTLGTKKRLNKSIRKERRESTARGEMSTVRNALALTSILDFYRVLRMLILMYTKSRPRVPATQSRSITCRHRRRPGTNCGGSMGMDIGVIICQHHLACRGLAPRSAGAGRRAHMSVRLRMAGARKRRRRRRRSGGCQERMVYRRHGDEVR
jgi:hypothetical protein